MVSSLDYDLIIVGSGLAGLRGAIQAARRNSKIRIGVISKVQVMRSHSVSAEGGTAAVLFPEDGDSIESHIYDTVKGSDFLADQDAAERLCKEMPDEIYQLEHWGMPWSRREDGKIGQRAFGGYSFPRASYASDKVGFFEMQTLYDTCQKFDNIEFLNEWFVTSILQSEQKFVGITAIELSNGNFHTIKGKALIIAKSNGTLAGSDIFIATLNMVNSSLQINQLIAECKQFQTKDIIFEISGNVASILQAERTALNFLQRISGIATITKIFSEKVQHYKAKIIDTRKTTPGLRELDKYGVRIGGGKNHRFNLGDGVLIKDTHIQIMKNRGFKLRQIIEKAKLNISHNMKIEIEVESLEDLKEAIAGKADTIMLDNMSINDMSEAVKICDGQAILEAS